MCFGRIIPSKSVVPNEILVQGNPGIIFSDHLAALSLPSPPRHLDVDETTSLDQHQTLRLPSRRFQPKCRSDEAQKSLNNIMSTIILSTSLPSPNPQLHRFFERNTFLVFPESKHLIQPKLT